jgi:hypothetical protein
MRKLIPYLCLHSILSIFPAIMSGQNVGINTDFPVRSLEIYGSLNQHARVQTTNTFGGQAILELLLGPPASSARDYKITNDGGTLNIMTGTDNFLTEGDGLIRFSSLGEVGIGTILPTSRLHIDGGQEASNTGDGYLLLGTQSSSNIVMDPNEILSRNNGAANTLTLQSHDDDTYIGNGGGHTYIGGDSGNLGIGMSSPSSRLTIEDDGFQITLRNTNGAVNQWYIGASNTSWTTSDNQLLFSPNQTSDAAVLRLLDVTENGGTVAPVMIRSSPNQTLLLDGNEIDTKSEPLYINHNSNQETYINPSGGRVGIGTDSPSTTLQVTTQEDEYAMRIQYGTTAWDLNPVTAFDYLGFIKEGWTLAYVNGASGQWTTISDRRMKENITELSPVMDKVRNLNTYTYNFRHSNSQKRQTGIIAQELVNVFPALVNENEGSYTVGYSKLSVIILKALQEQQTEIDALEKEIEALLATENR